MKLYEQTFRIRFGQCDPAGIVYHPQYFVMLNFLMEDFLREAVGIDFIEPRQFGLGFPVVGVRSDFCAPSREGDLCKARVWVEHIGSTSVRFAFDLRCGEELRLICTETNVCVKRQPDGKLAKHPLPDAMRSGLTPYLADDAVPRLVFRA